MGGLQGYSRLLVWLECLIFWALLYLYSTSYIKWLNYSVNLYGVLWLFFYIVVVLILCFCITAFSLLGYYSGIRAWSLAQLVGTSSFASKEEADSRDLPWRRNAFFPLFSLYICKVSPRRSIKWIYKGKNRMKEEFRKRKFQALIINMRSNQRSKELHIILLDPLSIIREWNGVNMNETWGMRP